MAIVLFPGLVAAQVSEVADNQWRHQLGVGTTYSAGNSDNSSVSVATDSGRRSSVDKLDFYSKIEVYRADGATTGEVGRLGAHYQREINRRGVYGFGQAEALRDTGAKIASRYTFGNGGGIHLVRSKDQRFDLFSGFGYAQDRFTEPNEVAGSLRRRYSRFELLLGMESFHRLTSNTTFKQRLVAYQNLTTNGLYRGELDMSLSVGINKKLSISTNLSVRYNTDPGQDLDRSDVSFITALTYKTN